MEDLRDEVEVAPALAVEEVDALAAVELQHGVFALLDGPGQQQMAARRGLRGHGSLLIRASGAA